LPEVHANITALNLKRRAPDVAPGKLSSSRFSLNLEGVSLREAFHKIAQESRIEIWVFRKLSERIVLNQLCRKVELRIRTTRHPRLF
jgi:hypothetical protein